MTVNAYEVYEPSIWRIQDLSKTYDYEGVTKQAFSPSIYRGRVVCSFDHVMYLSTNEFETKKKLADGWQPSWSPDGKWILYVSKVGEQSELFKIKPDGTGKKRITYTKCWEFMPAWSYDGKRFVYKKSYKDHEELVVADSNFKSQKIIASGPMFDGARFTPSGSIICAWAQGNTPEWIVDGELANCDIWLMNNNGSSKKKLTQNMRAGMPTMNQAGIVAFTSYKVFPDGTLYGNLYLLVDGQVKPLFEGYISRMNPVFDYEGKWLYFEGSH
jgi:Tol biopolymer transport system component